MRARAQGKRFGPRKAPLTMMIPDEVTALIGQGGMGEVYRATDSPDRPARFERAERECKWRQTIPRMVLVVTVGKSAVTMPSRRGSEPEQPVDLDDEHPVREVGKSGREGIPFVVVHDKQFAARLVFPAKTRIGA